MSENVFRQNPTIFKKAHVALAADQSEGDPIIGWDGKYNMLIPIYSSDVEFQIRESAEYDDEGNEVTPATAWVTYATFDALINDTVDMCSNYDYRFKTGTAGSRVVLGVQWGAVV